jgi:hypothetical protein
MDIEKDLNWVNVCIVAVQRALTSRTYVNYSIRDHIIGNLQHMPAQYRLEIAEDISRHIEQVRVERPETVTFWMDFRLKLLQE